MPVPEDEGEIGCWLGTPYWGQGIIPEAVRELIRYGFEEPGLKTVFVRLKDAKENERMIRQEDDWLYEQEINEGDQVVFTENRLYKRI